MTIISQIYYVISFQSKPYLVDFWSTASLFFIWRSLKNQRCEGFKIRK